jgi:hypothetical protein
MTKTKRLTLAQHQHQFYQDLMNMKNREITVTGSGKTMFNMPVLEPSTESTTSIKTCYS